MTDHELLSEIYARNPDELKRFYASKQSTPLTLASLEKWFLSVDGKQFYKFPKLMSLPLPRLGVLKGFYSWLGAAISEGEMKKVIESMKEFNDSVTKKIKETTTFGELITLVLDERVKFAGLINHLEERQKMVMHDELIIQIIAVTAIREDELPDVFNTQMHDEKVSAIKELIKSQGAYFFFQELQLKIPIDFTKISETDLTVLLDESKAYLQALPEILALFHQQAKSENPMPTLQNN